MIVAAAVCPHPPLLLSELGGQHDVVAGLRAACHRAVQVVLEHVPDVVVVVGGAESTREPAPAERLNLRAYGTLPARPEVPPHSTGLPLSLGIAARLLAESGWHGRTEQRAIAWHATSGECDGWGRRLAGHLDRIGLLVMGDGSARRGEKAPGYYDNRAHSFDANVARALTRGDCAALRALDVEEADRLLVQGRAALQVLGSAVYHAGAVPKAEMHYLDDPFGVLYFVSSWSLS